MLLGQMIERLADDAFAAEALLSLGDLPLLVEVEAAGRDLGESAATYAATAARHFADHASDEDWLALMTALERAADPGAACLRQMLVWSLHADSAGCTCAGGSTGECHD
jgi:hypothetical protein